MKRLNKVFKSCGFNFKQIQRTGDVAIYEKVPVKGSPRVSYEAIKISKHNGYNLGGNYVSPAETYPCNSMWGTSGWTATTLESADELYVKLINGPVVEKAVKLKSQKKPKNTTQPYLTCIVTGTQRPTTLKYLETKAEKLGVDVDELISHYISKPALSLLKDYTVVEARQRLGVKSETAITHDKLSRALELNGRKPSPVTA